MSKKKQTQPVKDPRQIDLEDWLKVDAVRNRIHNQAIDERMNKLLAASGIDVPSKYKGMTTEQVYNELKKENDK